MASHAVNVVVKARDEASRKFGHIGKSATGMGRMLKTAVLAAGVTVGIAGLIKGLKGIVAAASTAEETGSKFAAVFKEQAAVAAEFGANLASAVNRSKTELMGYLATLQDTFVPLGFARDQASSMSQAVTKLAIDLASFNDKADAEVVRDLQSALVGNHETVRKYGVIITQATLNQELMNLGVEKGMKGATEQHKALARLNLIMAGTTDAQGDATRTAGSFANQMKGLKADIFEASVTIGQQMLPTVTQFIQNFRTGFKIAGFAVQNWRLSLDIAFTAVALKMVEYWEDTKHLFGTVIPDLLSWFGRNWRNIFTDMWNFTKTVTMNMWENLVSFFDNIWKWLKGEEVDWKWTGLLEGFESTLEELPKIVKREITPLEKALSEELKDLKAQFAEQLAESLKVPILDAENLLKNLVLPTLKETAKLAKATKRGGLPAREVRLLGFGLGERPINYAMQTARNTAKLLEETKEFGGYLRRLVPRSIGVQLESASFA